MREQIQMVGKKFEGFTVLSESYQDKYKNFFYEVQCDGCGCKRIVSGVLLRSGRVSECQTCSKGRVISHGMAGSPIYNVWSGTLARRRDEVCERWLEFNNFFEDMSPRPDGFWLLRKDPKQKFCKENCYWSFRKSFTRRPKQDKQLELTQLIQEASGKINASYQGDDGEDVFVQFDRKETLEQDIFALMAAKEKELKAQETHALADIEKARLEQGKITAFKKMYKEMMAAPAIEAPTIEAPKKEDKPIEIEIKPVAKPPVVNKASLQLELATLNRKEIANANAMMDVNLARSMCKEGKYFNQEKLDWATREEKRLQADNAANGKRKTDIKKELGYDQGEVPF
jgi:hypothetical protein